LNNIFEFKFKKNELPKIIIILPTPIPR